jgi:hypothetical protein
MRRNSFLEKYKKELATSRSMPYSLRMATSTTTTTTTVTTVTTTTISAPTLVSVANRIGGAVKIKDECYASKFGRMLGFVTLLGIDLDVYSRDGSISREKLFEILEALATQAEAQESI